MKNQYPLYGGKVILEFEDGRHIYSVNGKPVWGVTSIVGVIDKPALKIWSANRAAEEFQALVKPGMVLDEMQIMQYADQIKNAWRKTTKDAADVGTLIHAWVEEFLKAGISRQPLPAMPINKEMRNSIDSLMSWAKKHKVKFVGSEVKVFSLEHGYAGTTDAEALVDGKLSIIDFKTGNALYPEFFLQTSAYLKAREEETGKKYPGGVWAIRLSKKDEVKGIEPFEAIKDEKTEEHFTAFLAALEIYRWQQKLRSEKYNQLNGNNNGQGSRSGGSIETLPKNPIRNKAGKGRGKKHGATQSKVRRRSAGSDGDGSRREVTQGVEIHN